MNNIRIKGDKKRVRYSVCDDRCIGRDCLALGFYQSRGATSSGSRNTGDSSPCCLNRAYHGCPDDKDARYYDEIAKGRKRDGHINC